MAGEILLISGPSGSGKSSLLKRLFAEFDNLYFSISSTTRAPRIGEIDGVNYHFISQNDFESDIKAGHFLEWAKVHENYYGTSLKPVVSALNDGKVVVFDIDVQGYFLASKIYRQIMTSVFITTKDDKTLESRLKNRGSDDESSITKRLQNAKEEIKSMDKYDYIIINDDLDKAYEELRGIFISMRAKRANVDIEALWQKWNLN